MPEERQVRNRDVLQSCQLWKRYLIAKKKKPEEHWKVRFLTDGNGKWIGEFVHKEKC